MRKDEIKEMLIEEINGTYIDYNRGYNLLWDIGLEDSKKKSIICLINLSLNLCLSTYHL